MNAINKWYTILVAVGLGLLLVHCGGAEKNPDDVREPRESGREGGPSNNRESRFGGRNSRDNGSKSEDSKTGSENAPSSRGSGESQPSNPPQGPTSNQNSEAVQKLQKAIATVLGDNKELVAKINDELEENEKDYLKDIEQFCDYKSCIQQSDIETILAGVERAISGAGSNKGVFNGIRESVTSCTGRVRSTSTIMNTPAQLSKIKRKLEVMRGALPK